MEFQITKLYQKRPKQEEWYHSDSEEETSISALEGTKENDKEIKHAILKNEMSCGEGPIIKDNDDSDLEIKEEMKPQISDSEQDDEENETVDPLELENHDEDVDIIEGYQSVSVKNYVSIFIEEEPHENIKSIFKESTLEFEKIKYHQRICEDILQNDIGINTFREIQNQYIAHLRAATEIEVFSCTLCQYQTLNKNNLNCHFLAFHKGLMQQEIFQCKKCNFETNSESVMRNHLLKLHKNHVKQKSIKVKENKEKFPCSECSYQGRSAEGLKRHVATAHNKKDKIKCDLCSFESNDKNVLKTHKDTHRKDGTFYCYKCSYKNGSKLTLALHLLKEHKIENEMSKRSKICEVCSMPCTSITKLKRHSLSHVNIKELDESQLWKCPEPGCDYLSKTKNNLNLHVRTHKSPEFVCEICGFAMKRKESYKWHLETHKKFSEIDWIPCKICPYRARTKRHLYQHMKIGVHDGASRVHMRRRNLQAEGIPIPEGGKRVDLKQVYNEAITGAPSVKKERKLKKENPKKNKFVSKKSKETISLHDAIINLDELAREIVKNEIN